MTSSSGILSRMDRSPEKLDVRGACAVSKPMSILWQADHQVIFIEHDPQLYDGAAEMVGEVSQARGD